MTLWHDNQLPPALTPWMRTTLSIDRVPVRDLNLHRASAPEIFRAARDAQVVVMTKDADFVALLDQQGAPLSPINGSPTLAIDDRTRRLPSSATTPTTQSCGGASRGSA